jgi:hypothetical protein
MSDILMPRPARVSNLRIIPSGGNPLRERHRRSGGHTNAALGLLGAIPGLLALSSEGCWGLGGWGALLGSGVGGENGNLVIVRQEACKLFNMTSLVTRRQLR